MNVYDFRRGHSFKGCNPQLVGSELERIRAEKGRLTPDDVVEAATDPDSPLHAAFPWDDKEAAHQHRLSVARRLVISVRVINSPVAENIPAFVSVRTPDVGRSYVPTVEALSEEELKARVLMEARKMIEGLQRRYAAFQNVVIALESLKKQAG